MARAAQSAQNADTLSAEGSGSNQKPRATGDLSADFEAQMKHLKSEMSRLAESISNAGYVMASDTKDSARQRSRELQRSSEETIRELRRQLDALEASVSGHVRERPLTALAAAAGVGFLVALLARR